MVQTIAQAEQTEGLVFSERKKTGQEEKTLQVPLIFFGKSCALSARTDNKSVDYLRRKTQTKSPLECGLGVNLRSSVMTADN